jgi:hypothetical protein
VRSDGQTDMTKLIVAFRNFSDNVCKYFERHCGMQLCVTVGQHRDDIHVQ